MKKYAKPLLWMSPRLYHNFELRQLLRARATMISQLTFRSSPDEVQLAHHGLDVELHKVRDKLQELDDEQLLARARKFDVQTEDIQVPKHLAHLPIWQTSLTGQQALTPFYRSALRSRIRAKLPDYRRERREAFLLWISLLSAVAGCLGSSAALLSVLGN